MARISSTSFVNTAHGRIGDVIIKTYRYGKVATRVPRMGPYLPTEKQRAGNDRWAAAGAYYLRVKADPVLRACYAKLREKKGAPLSAITARDFIAPPPPAPEPGPPVAEPHSIRGRIDEGGGHL